MVYLALVYRKKSVQEKDCCFSIKISKWYENGTFGYLMTIYAAWGKIKKKKQKNTTINYMGFALDSQFSP